DLAIDGSQHDPLHLLQVIGLPQRPTQFNPRHLWQHVAKRYHTLRHHVTTGLIYKHMNITPDGLQRHVYSHILAPSSLKGRVELPVHVPEACSHYDNPLVTVVNE